MKWHVVYRRAIEDGKLFFPEKLTHEFLRNAQKTMGSYVFANQYLNQIIPSDLQTFKKEWFKYFDDVPKNVTTFIHIDPAISQADGADYTGVVVVSIDTKKNWYVRFARRYKISPTELVDLVFRLNDQFQPHGIGIEEVAYQKALLYFMDDEMRRRNVVLPLKGVKPPTDKTKEMRILGALVPRIEWGHTFFDKGLIDLELELLQFPRGAHDDLIDALASIEYIFYPPEEEKKWAKPPGPSHPKYESWYIEQLQKRNNSQGGEA